MNNGKVVVRYICLFRDISIPAQMGNPVKIPVCFAA